MLPSGYPSVSARLIKVFFTFIMVVSILVYPWSAGKNRAARADYHWSPEPQSAGSAGIGPFQPTGTFETPGIPSSDFFVTRGGLLVDYWTLHWSNDGGRMWKEMAGWPCNGEIRVAAMSPFFDQDYTFFVGTSTGDNSFCVTNNAGRSWHTPATPLIGPFTSVAVSPAFDTDGTIFTAGNAYDGSVLWRSVDRGEHWSAVSYPPVAASLDQIVFSPRYSGDHTLFARMGNSSLWRSEDSGASWVDAGGGILPDGSQVRKIWAVPAPGNGIGLFAISAKGMAISYDRGSTWEWLNDFNFYDFTVPDDVLTSRVIFASIGDFSYGFEITRSTDLGKTWQPWKNHKNLFPSSLPVFSPGYSSDHSFSFSDGMSFYKSSDQGDTLEKISDKTIGYYYDEIIQILTTPTLQPGLVVAVSKGTVYPYGWALYQSQDSGYHWQKVTLPENSGTALNLTISPNYAADHLVFVSINRALYQWNPVTDAWSLLNGNLPTYHADLIRVSPAYANDQTIWIASDGGGLYRSNDRGKSWTQMTGFDPYVTDLELSPGYPNDPTLFISVYNDGIFRSVNNGASWVSLGSPNFSPNYNVELSPTFPQDHLIFTAINGQSSGGVFRSENKGDTWSNISADLPKTYVKSLSISPRYTQDQTLLAGLDHEGAYLSEDGGATWFEIKSMPGQFDTPTALAYENGLLAPFAASTQTVYRYDWPTLAPPNPAEITFNPNELKAGQLMKTLILPAGDAPADVPWSIEASAGWLTANPLSGMLPGSVAIQVDPQKINLYADTYLSLTLYRSYKQRFTVPIKVVALNAFRTMLPVIRR